MLYLLQALSLAEQERSVLQERLSGVQRDAEAAEVDFVRQKRDLLSRVDQFQTTVEGLQTELKNTRINFNDIS